MARIFAYHEDIDDGDLESPSRRFVLVRMPLGNHDYRVEYLQVRGAGKKRPPIIHAGAARSGPIRLSAEDGHARCDKLNDLGVDWAEANI